MKSKINPIIDRMKTSLMHRVEEWLGFDIPKEGTEDHDRWMGMVLDIEDIATIQDVISYLGPRAWGRSSDIRFT